MPLIVNVRAVDFSFQDGSVTTYSPYELWYDMDGLVHYIQVRDRNNITQLYTLMKKETDVAKRKKLLINLVRVATIASGANQVYKDFENGNQIGSSIVINSLITVSKVQNNSSKAQKLANFLFGGTEKDYRFEYYNVDTGHIWHDEKIFINVDSHDLERFYALE